MRNIDHVFTHFDGNIDYKKWLKVNEHFCGSDNARKQLSYSVERNQPLSLMFLSVWN